MVLRERMMRPRNSSRLYNHAVETPASAATVRKLISRSDASIRWRAAKARCIALLLRSRALRLRPSVFLGMCSPQRCDDIDQVVSFPLIHFDLTCPRESESHDRRLHAGSRSAEARGTEQFGQIGKAGRRFGNQAGLTGSNWIMKKNGDRAEPVYFVGVPDGI